MRSLETEADQALGLGVEFSAQQVICGPLPASGLSTPSQATCCALLNGAVLALWMEMGLRGLHGVSV